VKCNVSTSGMMFWIGFGGMLCFIAIKFVEDLMIHPESGTFYAFLYLRLLCTCYWYNRDASGDYTRPRYFGKRLHPLDTTNLIKNKFEVIEMNIPDRFYVCNWHSDVYRCRFILIGTVQFRSTTPDLSWSLPNSNPSSQFLHAIRL